MYVPLAHRDERWSNHLCIAAVKLALDVTYPDEYPDVLPELSLETLDGELDEDEVDALLKELHAVVRAAVDLHKSCKIHLSAGRGESWHGHDFHPRITPKGAAVCPGPVKG